MNRKILLFLMAMAGVISASAQVFKNDELQITKIEDKTWVIETADNNTMYLIEGKRKSLLVDTGSKCENLDKIIAKITAKPVDVVLTHAHPDHTGSIGFFDQIFIHPADTVLLDKSYKGKLRLVTDGYVFRLGGRNIKVYSMPAHTPGSIVLADEKSGSCFSGDAFGSGQVWLQLKPLAPISAYVAACARMERLMDDKGISKIYCGHYPYIKKAFDKNYMRDMRLLAVDLVAGTALSSEPYPIKVPIGPENPMIVTKGAASIVYDPDHIK